MKIEKKRLNFMFTKKYCKAEVYFFEKKQFTVGVCVGKTKGKNMLSKKKSKTLRIY